MLVRIALQNVFNLFIDTLFSVTLIEFSKQYLIFNEKVRSFPMQSILKMCISI